MKVISEVPVKEVDLINHNWKVKKKVITGSINFYLLVDVNNPGVYDVVKESKDPVQHFSGRIVTYEDVERKYVFNDIVVKDGIVKEVRKSIPYIHKLWDFAKAKEEEAQEVFGKEYKSFVLKDKYTTEYLFYNLKEVKKAPKEVKEPKSKASDEKKKGA